MTKPKTISQDIDNSSIDADSFKNLLRAKKSNRSVSNSVPTGNPSEMGIILRSENAGPADMTGGAVDTQMGLGEAILRRAGQGLYGLGDEVEAMGNTADTIYGKDEPLSDFQQNARLRFTGQEGDNVRRLDLLNRNEVVGSDTDIYQQQLQMAQDKNTQALNDRPLSAVLGELPASVLTYMFTPGGPAAATGLHSFGASGSTVGADPEDIGQVLLNTVAGTAMGKAGQIAGNKIGSAVNKIRNAIGAGPAQLSVTGGLLNSATGGLAGGAFAASQGGGVPEIVAGSTVGYLGTKGFLGLPPVTAEMLRQAPAKANWLLQKFTPMAKHGLQFAIMEVFPSFVPGASVLRDVQDRQTVSNIIMNNNGLDTEQKAARVERVMKDGNFRYDDLPDDWYIQRGVQPEVQELPFKRADM